MDKKIKVYSAPSCPYCTMVKQFLKESNIAFEDIDVSVNQQAAQEMVDKTGQMGIPVVDIDGEIVIGFDQDKIKGLLDL